MSVFSTRPIPATKYSAIFQFRKLTITNYGTHANRLDFLEKLSSENRIKMMGVNFARARSSEHQEGIKSNLDEGLTLDIANDRVEATLNNLSKWLVCFLFVGIVLWRHDSVALWATVGSVINNVLSITLKNTLKHERPIPALRSDPGMPSTHAQSIFYIITFLNLSLLELYGINGGTIALTGISFILGSYFSWLRISQQLHTVSQVMVGAILGSIFSMFWFWSWDAYVLHLFDLYLPVKIIVVAGAMGFGVSFLNFCRQIVDIHGR